MASVFVDPESQTTSAVVEKECVTDKLLNKISLKILRSEYRFLARELDIGKQKVKKIESNCTIKNFGEGEIVYKILSEWKQIKGKEATKSVLIEALKVIQRQDVVDEVFKEPESPSTTHRTIEEPQILIGDEQRKLYQRVELPQEPWMKKILPLEELYVDLEMLKTRGDPGDSGGVEIKLQELFDKTEGEDPLRILIEGGPGFGKTTLCLKLLNDWGRNRDYIGSKFKMVFMIQLRYCKEGDSIEGLLKTECSVVGVDADQAIECIRTFESETLLILDGFDEINEECKRNFIPLLEKKKFPTMFVVVTSRRGMFHLEKKNEDPPAGMLKTLNEDESKIQFWNKKILIKGVTDDKIKLFMQKYLNIDFQELQSKIISVAEKEMREIMKCPLFLILVATMIENKKLEKVNSKTSLCKEFFNFITRRSLIREKRIKEDQKVDLFNDSLDHLVIKSLVEFGLLAIDSLCQNELMLEKEKILEHCKDEIVLHLGFLVKLTKFQNHQADDFYQPIHKSFFEFVAAVATWKIYNKSQDQFIREMERMRDKGLKPTEDSLFYVFLGGLMNSQAHVLFQCLTQYHLWFNIENFCFQNILLEIQDVDSFCSSLNPLFEPFIPSVYRINEHFVNNRNFLDSRIHSLILKYASDRQLIKCFDWNCGFSFNSPQEFYIETLHLDVDNKISSCFFNESKYFIRCKNLICKISEFFKADNWKDFVNLMNSIESENYYFDFYLLNCKINNLFLKEMTGGQWKRKNIDRVTLNMNHGDDDDDDDDVVVESVLMLVDLVKKKRIEEGIWLNFRYYKRTEEKMNRLKEATQELINEIINSKNIREFSLQFYKGFDYLDLDGMNNMKWRSLRYNNECLIFLNSFQKKNEKISVEEVEIDSVDDENYLHLIENIEGIKWLSCWLNELNSLIEKSWLNLTEIEELELTDIERYNDEELPKIPRLCSQLINLQVLSLHVYSIKTSSLNCRDSFVNLFFSLNLRICEFLDVENLELFCFLTEVVMEGLKKKEEEGRSSSVGGHNLTMKSKEGNKVQLHELVLQFHYFYVDSNQLKKCRGIECIRSMLLENRLGKFSWFYSYYYTDKMISDILLSWFPWNKKFKITQGVEGLDPKGSRRSQYNYRWSTNIYYVFRVQFIGN